MSAIPNRPRRWGLPLSLAFNVFLIAVIGVHEWHRPHGPPGPGRMMEDIARSLPEADAAILRQRFAAEPLLRTPFRDGRDMMTPVREAMRAEPFDPAALEAAFGGLHQDRSRFDQALERALITAATAMSPEGRRRLADHRGPPGPPPGPPPER
ncbi:MAG: periplasmic heavy metal sensor [Rhodospirillaceae bacterium]